MPRLSDHEALLRKTQLIALLKGATATHPLSQSYIVENLTINYGQGDIKAYVGDETATRQKFERDKKELREEGFFIATSTMEGLDGPLEGYYLPNDNSTVELDLTDDERELVATALAFCGFGSHGMQQAIAGDAGQEGGLYFSPHLSTAAAAIKNYRRLKFSHLTRNNVITVEPIKLHHAWGAFYLVAHTVGTPDDEVYGYRLDRISGSMTPESKFAPSTETLAAASAWRFGTAKEDVLLVDVETSRLFGAYLEKVFGQMPGFFCDVKKGERVNVTIPFPGYQAARNFLYENADKIRLRGPSSFKKSILEDLKNVNSMKFPTVENITFPAPRPRSQLRNAFNVLKAIHESPDGLRVSEIATRFSLTEEDARSLLANLATIEYFTDTSASAIFPAGIERDYEDFEDDADQPDPIYRPSSDALSDVDLSALRLGDALEVRVALQEAALFDSSDNKFLSVAKKLDTIIGANLTFDDPTSTWEPQFHDALFSKTPQVFTFEYIKSGESAPRRRRLVPVDLKYRHGFTYVYGLDLSLIDGDGNSSPAWRNFRVDRIVDMVSREDFSGTLPSGQDPDWLTSVGLTGDEVWVAFRRQVRYLFDDLPHVAIATLDQDMYVAKFKVNDMEWLNRLMWNAGAHAAVVKYPDGKTQYANAGKDKAKELMKELKAKK